MNSEPHCEECRRLHEAASAAISDHLRAAARLSVARLRYQADLIGPLEQTVGAAKETREVAVSAFKQHRKTHSAVGSGGTAMSQTG